MEPRSIERGEQLRMQYEARLKGMLQWSHVQSNVERPAAHSRLPALDQPASMEPRSIERGEERPAIAHRGAEPASMEPRSIERGETGSAPTQ